MDGGGPRASMDAMSPTGLTKDAGWQVGVSRTVPFDRGEVWAVLVSAEGLGAWLGRGASPNPEVGAPYTTADGTTGEMRSWRVEDRLRATRLVGGDDHETTVQIALGQAKTGTRITFHQERMASEAERTRMRAHWQDVADEILDLLVAAD